ncbi:MAG: glycosyltransferase family 4 protein [Armatimonadota bacterium]
MSRIKVVHICDKFGMKGSTVHGASRLFSWWMPRFDYGRFDVKLYGLKKPDQSSRALEAEGVRLTYLYKSAADPTTLLSFLKVLRRDHPDIVHLHGWTSAHYGRIAGRLARIPTIMHEHGAHPFVPKSQQVADRLLSKLTDIAVAVSRASRDFLVHSRYVDPQKVRVIFNGVPISDFHPLTQDAVRETRECLGIPPDCPVVGTIGRLDIEKGMDHFLRAAKVVLGKFPSVRFLIVGDGPLRQDLEQMTRDLEISSSVLFTGYRPDVPRIQSIIGIQVFASLWDGAPLTAFEAMAMGKAVVTTNAGGLAEIFEHEQTALVVPPGDSGALADAVGRLLGDNSLAYELGRNARDVSRKYDINHTVRNLESLYEEVSLRRSGTMTGP